ncbi:hypothetical protein OKA04_10765 [Luteolibacter flavescens]|uniref:Tetratricopeptide repeat protein n=1 Tax=Luteolibacter flavescens TaxID=1859460 RepID=A0ABT3FNQ9_9BACT|nr:hypothetical protein [Luteolibacter flavescens]MCW1885210.1 hypothetical protein [Luteolibacter flavescens]
MPNHLRSDLVFRLSCWVLGLVAFAQLLTAGVALAVRVERAQEVRIVEKEVPSSIITMAPAAPPAMAVVPPTPKKVVELPPLPEATVLPAPRPLTVPAIADPVVERLVSEARKARLADDMGAAITKLGEARSQAPQDPNVLYELALVYEDMAAADPLHADQAADAYQQILALGTTGAGSLYALAGEKLAAGISMPSDLRGEMALGRVRIFKDDDHEEGQRVVVTVPVHAGADAKIEEGDLEVRVRFFDSVMKGGKREILESVTQVPSDRIEYPSMPFDFATGEELIRFPYIIPSDDLQQTHLFGKREYYGQVVELIYKGEVLDYQAWPRHLSSRSGSAQQQSHQQQGNPWDQMPEFLSEDMISTPGVLPGRQNEFPPDMPADPYADLPMPPPDR